MYLTASATAKWAIAKSKMVNGWEEEEEAMTAIKAENHFNAFNINKIDNTITIM